MIADLVPHPHLKTNHPNDLCNCSPEPRKTPLVELESIILELFRIGSIVAIVVRRIRIPYTVALVVAGLGLSFCSSLQIELTSELILTLLLPPLVFEAAYQLNFERLRDILAIILLLAVPGVILTMLLVGGFVAVGANMSLEVVLIFGVLIAAADPVSVVAIFRKLDTRGKACCRVELGFLRS